MYYQFDIPSYEYKGISHIKTSNSTDVVPPPVQEHQCLIWNGIKWEIHPDYRGTKFYSESGLLMGEYGCIGPIPSDFILKEPPELRTGESVEWSKERNDWVIHLDTGWIYDGEHVPRPMTPAEKVYYGIDILPSNMKIDGDYIVPKTPYELYADGIITLEEANSIIRIVRENEYKEHTDKYGMMCIRGEITLDLWREEIQKIKDANPYITEVDNG